MAKFRYIGKGAFLVGVPAKDLTSAEVRKYGPDWLLASGLYEAPAKKVKTEKPKVEDE